MLQESMLGETTLLSEDMQETMDELDHETLSLCDLPLYSDQSADWEGDSSPGSQRTATSISSPENDYFEFCCTQQLISPSSTTLGFPPENIIFCGKLISYKQQPTIPLKDSSRLVADNKNKTKKKGSAGCVLFRWKVSSRNRKRSTKLMHKKDHVPSSLQHFPKKMYTTNKHGKEYDLPVHKMSILTSSSSGRAKWYLFLFGITRFSPEVELKDIKCRQSRRQYCPPPPPRPPPLPPMFELQNRDEKPRGQRNIRWGLWGLIRALSCGGNHQKTTTVATGCGQPE